MSSGNELRQQIGLGVSLSELQQGVHLGQAAELLAVDRAAISQSAATLVNALRAQKAVSFLESFLGEYGLSTEEGVALMSMAEAYLRVPDDATVDDLIAEKIAGSNWQSHSGHAPSLLVNASTWALMLTGKLLSDAQTKGLVKSMRSLLKRLGEPVVRLVMAEAMERMGDHFVIGETIRAALKRAQPREQEGYSFSYDMLGESVSTEQDAERYFNAYKSAIKALANNAGDDLHTNPGISVKLSALHPRFETLQKARAFDPLLERIRELCLLAADNNLGLSIDAEEAERLDFSLDIIDALLATPALQDWPGLGAVVQAYSRNALAVIDWLYFRAHSNRRRIMLRLVKGAYWDTEIKRAQVLGLASFPVFTHKALTDVSYLAATRKLLAMNTVIYPQFATHNAHTLGAILHMAGQCAATPAFELQRLYGMGQALHERIRTQNCTRHRIYAPVGVHEDLLAYLVRRLLENGANSSFVHQLTNNSISVQTIVEDPLARLERLPTHSAVSQPARLYGDRQNSRGLDLANEVQLVQIEAARAPWLQHLWQAESLLHVDGSSTESAAVRNPACLNMIIGRVGWANRTDIEQALTGAAAFEMEWESVQVAERAACLRQAADLIEQHHGEIFALLQLEGGKVLADAVAEWREAIDLLRYYALRSRNHLGVPHGTFVCISPWNFPLAIFCGQIAAALVTGNTVIAKPAEQTPLLAWRVVRLLHEAGIPRAALQLVLGDGEHTGAALCGDPRVNGLCFTGSLDTARAIHRQMASTLAPSAPLIAETGGINAMIVDSTALPEQTVTDIISSAFSSCGQRCSALRVLYLQEEVADNFLTMLKGAMNTLKLGDPLERDTDIGPVIDADAHHNLQSYIKSKANLPREGMPDSGYFVPPVLIEVGGIADIEREVFGPVLHVARFKLEQLDSVLNDINDAGYGLTAAIHSRLSQRVERCVQRLRIGNIYINRNQIGAVVESQPFGGEGLSGTGPKAGGPNYLRAFLQSENTGRQKFPTRKTQQQTSRLDPSKIQLAIDELSNKEWAERRDRWQFLSNISSHSIALKACELISEQEMPGPTGELNVYQLMGLDCALCLGPSPQLALEQALQALVFGGAALICGIDDSRLQQTVASLQQLQIPVAFLPGDLLATDLVSLSGFSSVSWCGAETEARRLRQALAARDGAIIRFITEPIRPCAYIRERHVCSDTTSCGGNIELMTASQ